MLVNVNMAVPSTSFWVIAKDVLDARVVCEGVVSRLKPQPLWHDSPVLSKTGV